MSRKLFLSDLEKTFETFPNNRALVYGSADRQFSITYSSLRAISTDLCHKFEQIFKTKRMHICVNIETKSCLLPVFIALWKNNLSPVCIKDERCFNKCMELLHARYLITDQECDYNLKESLTIMHHRLLIYELHTEPARTFPPQWDMCYAVFTSGSTGAPKLVQVPWSCILPNVNELIDIWKITEADVIAWRSPYTFDPFFVELMGSLSRGACLKVDEAVSALQKFSWNCEEQAVAVTVLQTTPSIFKSLSWDCSALRVLILGGEILSKSFQLPRGVRVFNIYGITEISCWSFIQEVGNEERYSIGKPLQGIIYKVENDELWIGSQSRKCLVDSELPETLSEVVFRPTGDLVEISEEIFIVDRTDNVVKILGNKVSLSHIYSKLDAFRDYDNHCVVFDQESHITSLFLVDRALKETKQRISSDFLVPQLKPIERPDVVFKIPKMPLSSHGKIDTSALKKLARLELLEANHNVKKTFERLWCELLGLDSVPVEKSFTQCGGDSVTGLKLITRLNAENVTVPPSLVKKLLGSFSFRECHALIDEKQTGDHLPAIDDDVSLSVRWSFNMKKCIDATPSFVQVDGIWCVCVGSHSSQISLLECESGRHLWTVCLGDRVESGIAVAEDHKRLFTGCYDQHIYCIEAVDGKIVWKFRTAGMIKSTPRISKNGCFIFCGSYDKHMYCLDAGDGSIKSSIPMNGSILATPVLSEAYLLFGTLSGECCAVEPDSLCSVWSKTLKSPVFSSPCVIHSGAQVLFAEVEGYVHSFQVSSGETVWKIQCGGNIFSGLTAATMNEKHFVMFGCHDRHIYRLDVTHEPVITSKILLDSPIACAPSVANQYLACVSSAGFLYVIHLLKQKIISRLEINGETFSSPQWHGKSIFFGSRNDNLICVDLNKSLISYLHLLKSQNRLGNKNLARK